MLATLAPDSERDLGGALESDFPCFFFFVARPAAEEAAEAFADISPFIDEVGVIFVPTAPPVGGLGTC